MFKEIVEVTDISSCSVRVKFTRSRMCSCCLATSFCCPGKETLELSRPEFELKKGDKIEVGIAARKNLYASCLMFFIPAVIFFLSLFFFRGRGELTSFLLAVLLLFGYYVAVRLVVNRSNDYFSAVILRKI